MKPTIAALFCLIASVASLGQDYPKAEVYGGYSYVNIDTNGLTSRQSANGWEASIAGSFSRWFAVEGDFGGFYKTYSEAGVEVKVTDYFFAGGPRINVRPLFIHALIGGDHLTGSSSGESLSQDSFAGAFGGGVEWPVSRRLAVRGGVDYVFTRHNILGGPSYTQNNVRVGAGIVYVFGGGAKSSTTERSSSSAHVPPSYGRGMQTMQLGLIAIARLEGGAEITEVAPSSLASFAGLRVGDVINAVDGKTIKTPMELQSELSGIPAGSKVKLGYMVRGYWQAETVVILK